MTAKTTEQKAEQKGGSRPGHWGCAQSGILRGAGGVGHQMALVVAFLSGTERTGTLPKVWGSGTTGYLQYQGWYNTIIQPTYLGSYTLSCCLAIDKFDSGDLPRFTTGAIENCIKYKTLPIRANLCCTNSDAFLLHRSTVLELFSIRYQSSKKPRTVSTRIET